MKRANIDIHNSKANIASLCKSALKYLFTIARDILTYICTFDSRIFPPNEHTKSIIIIRNDAIGDYLLFRNYLAEVRKSFPNHHITLLGNIAYKDFTLRFDMDYIDSLICINPQNISQNPLYRIRHIRTLRRITYSILLNPIYSRDRLNFFLSAYIIAKEKFAPQGDIINASPKSKARNDRIYTRLFASQKGVMFEFYRNKEFFAAFLAKPLDTKLYIDTTKLDSRAMLEREFMLPKDYALLFIGASSAYRKWSIEHFAKVAIYLIESYHQNIVICGGKEDVLQAKRLESFIDSSAKAHNLCICNLAGKTSLTQLGSLVYNGNLLLTNETSCAHLGVPLDTTIIVVSNGNHLGRFIPYPKEIADKYYPVFHHFIQENIARYEELSNAFAYKSTLDINEIQPESVMAIIDTIYKKERQ